MSSIFHVVVISSQFNLWGVRFGVFIHLHQPNSFFSYKMWVSFLNFLFKSIVVSTYCRTYSTDNGLDNIFPLQMFREKCKCDRPKVIHAMILTHIMKKTELRNVRIQLISRLLSESESWSRLSQMEPTQIMRSPLSQSLDSICVRKNW